MLRTVCRWRGLHATHSETVEQQHKHSRAVLPVSLVMTALHPGKGRLRLSKSGHVDSASCKAVVGIALGCTARSGREGAVVTGGSSNSACLLAMTS